jgi:hypothetical protein
VWELADWKKPIKMGNLLAFGKAIGDYGANPWEGEMNGFPVRLGGLSQRAPTSWNTSGHSTIPASTRRDNDYEVA